MYHITDVTFREFKKFSRQNNFQIDLSSEYLNSGLPGTVIFRNWSNEQAVVRNINADTIRSFLRTNSIFSINYGPSGITIRTPTSIFNITMSLPRELDPLSVMPVNPASRRNLIFQLLALSQLPNLSDVSVQLLITQHGFAETPRTSKARLVAGAPAA